MPPFGILWLGLVQVKAGFDIYLNIRQIYMKIFRQIFCYLLKTLQVMKAIGCTQTLVCHVKRQKLVYKHLKGEVFWKLNSETCRPSNHTG